MEEVEAKKRIFGPEEEKAIISMVFDSPELFANIGRHLEPEYFEDLPTRYVYTIINHYLNKHDVILTRPMCLDHVAKNLTVDDPYEDILAVVNRKSDPRDIPVVKETLIEWAKNKAYAQMYSKDAIDSFERGDYDKLEEILENAKKITDVSNEGFWFFDQLDKLFIEDKEEKLTTGFSRLDAVLNEGGPTRKEVVCVMAPTGVGKSISLVNSSVASIRRGYNVLFITLELSQKKVGYRHAGAFTEIPIRMHKDKESMVRDRLSKIKSDYGAELIIHEFPPDDISVDAIHAILDSLRRIHGITIDVVVIDYLELLLSRNPAANKDDYTRQKRVATEIRRLAKKENVLVFTATQTNRSGGDVQAVKGDGLIDLNKTAESYGKTMPLDYIITLNQSKAEYNRSNDENADPNKESVMDAGMRLYIAKNRNGPKHKMINIKVNYDTMKMEQEEFF